MNRILTAATFALLAGLPAAADPPAEKPATPAKAPSAADKFEATVKKFEEQDRKSPPAKGGILFCGSSTVAGWKTSKNFPDLPTINRGIGSTHISHAVQFADRIAIPYAPKVIAFYAGDNDISAGKSPETVEKDFRAFAEKIHAKLPETRIIFISIKPSILRWNLWPKIQDANRRVEAFCKSDKNLAYLDISPATLGADGKPDPSLFLKDGLHLNEKGYAAWSALLRPLLDKWPGR